MLLIFSLLWESSEVLSVMYAVLMQIMSNIQYFFTHIVYNTLLCCVRSSHLLPPPRSSSRPRRRSWSAGAAARWPTSRRPKRSVLVVMSFGVLLRHLLLQLFLLLVVFSFMLHLLPVERCIFGCCSGNNIMAYVWHSALFSPHFRWCTRSCPRPPPARCRRICWDSSPSSGSSELHPLLDVVCLMMLIVKKSRRIQQYKPITWWS